MKIMKDIEAVSTDNLLNLIGSFFMTAFCLGFFGGISLVFLLISKDVTQSNKGFIGAFASIALLLFLLFADRHLRKKIIPEIRKRCAKD